MNVNLAVIATSGNLHSAAFLEPMRYIAFTLRNLGYSVAMSVNKIDQASINVLFGAHSVVEAIPDHSNSLVIVNLEQLVDRQPDEPRVSDSYRRLLRENVVIDYDRRNLPFYRPRGDATVADVMIFEFAHAPYLRSEALIPLEDRPIDLLFFGSVNTTRAALIRRVEASGVAIRCVTPRNPVYGDEINHLIRQSKAVLNAPFYASRVFEQVRAFQVLSCGTPMISIGAPDGPRNFRDCIHWVPDLDVERFFLDDYKSSDWYFESRAQLRRWVHNVPSQSSVGWSQLFESSILK